MDCEICDELTGNLNGKALWPKLINGRNRILMENEDFVAIASIGPIGLGHSLIVPRQHCNSMSRITNQEGLRSFRWELEDRLSNDYNEPVLVFEHGGSENCTPCTIDHAHLHLIPSKLPVKNMLVTGINWEPVSEPIDKSGEEYLLVGCKDQFWIGKSDSPFQSQILRKTYVESCRLKLIWDWHQNYSLDMVLTTLDLWQKTNFDIQGPIG